MKKHLQPPKWADSIIDNLAPAELAEEIRGDLYELFVSDTNRRSLRIARINYILNAMGFLVKSFFWRNTGTNPMIMTRSYFKMAWRSLMAYKATTFINISGLIVGIAATLVIIAVLRFEQSFDTFHTKSEQTYRLVRVSGRDMSEFRTGVSFPVPIAMKEEMSLLAHITAVEYFGGANVDVLDHKGTSIRKFREEAGFALVDSSFFKVFDFAGTGFHWISGDANTAFKDAYSIVLTESMAKKYFGDQDAMGKSIKLQQKYDCKITGVITDFPPNTDFPFTVLISYPTTPILAGGSYDDWFGVHDTHNVFVVPTPGTTKSEFEAQIDKVHAAHTPKDIHELRHYRLQELNELHFDSRYGNFNMRTISHATVTGLACIAVFLLLTASINYVNLATAQSSLRAREIGLRKVLGSNRKNLVLQFFTETFVIVLVSAIIACGVAELTIINFHSLLNLPPTGFTFMDPVTFLFLLAIVFSVTLFSGAYPSLMISKFNPVSALKNKFSTESIGGVSLRKVLVVVQFTITQILVVGTYIVVSQMQFFSNVDMGFNKEGVISARIPMGNREPNRLKVMQQQLESEAFVSDVTFSYSLPSGVNRNRWYADIGNTEAGSMQDYKVFEYVAIDSAYLSFYDIDLLAGRNLTINDTSRNVVINKTLLENLALGTPDEALGKDLKMGDGTIVHVVGVVEDYYSNSLKERADNMVLLMQPENYSVVSVKLHASDGQSLQNAIKGVGKVWTATFPDFVFTYEFLDQNIMAFYKQEQKYAQLFQMFSFVFLLIGCLGLYGLITFLVNRKSKEVAIRKVLGATLSNILVLFSREYVRLILLSFLLAVPIAWYFTDQWLSTFANHIALQWWLFLIPGGIVLTIAALVVGAKTLRTANMNPVEKLKYE